MTAAASPRKVRAVDRARQPVLGVRPSRTPAGRTSSWHGALRRAVRDRDLAPGGVRGRRRARSPRRRCRSRGSGRRTRRRAAATPPAGVPAWAIRPSLHHHDPVGERERLALVVGDGEHGGAQPAEEARAVRRRAVRAVHGRAGRAARPASAAGARGARARASATRCCSPPDSAATARRCGPGQPDQIEQLGDRAPARLRVGAPRIRSPKATLPPTSRCGKSWWSWNIRPDPAPVRGHARLVPRRPATPARVGRLQPGDHPQQRGLAAAARARARTRSRARRPPDRPRPARRRAAEATVTSVQSQQAIRTLPDRSVRTLQHQQRRRAHHHQDGATGPSPARS